MKDYSDNIESKPVNPETGEQTGPTLQEQLKQYASPNDGRVMADGEMYMWHPGLDEWVRLNYERVP